MRVGYGVTCLITVTVENNSCRRIVWWYMVISTLFIRAGHWYWLCANLPVPVLQIGPRPTAAPVTVPDFTVGRGFRWQWQWFPPLKPFFCYYFFSPFIWYKQRRFSLKRNKWISASVSITRTLLLCILTSWKTSNVLHATSKGWSPDIRAKPWHLRGRVHHIVSKNLHFINKKIWIYYLFKNLSW